MEHRSTIGRSVQAVAPVLSRIAPGLAARALELLFMTPLPRPVSEREHDWMSLATRSVVRFDQSRNLAVYAWGVGPTILLVHGWSGRASQLGLYVAPLVDRGFRVVAFDAPAHGESDGRFSALPELAIAVERVAAAVGPVTGILAHSLGAAATTLALGRGVQLGRVVYIAPPEDLADYLHRLGQFLGFPREIAIGARERLERRFGAPFEEARGSNIAPRLGIPLLVFHDESDREVPFSEGQRLAECWRNATLVSTQGLGHHRIVWDLRVIRKSVEFLVGDAVLHGANQ